MQQSESHSKLYGFVMMFLSSSLMGGIGAFARYIEAPGLFISFCRNSAGLILMTLIFLIGKKYYKFRGFRVTPMIVLTGVFLGLLSGLYVMSTQMTTLANAAFLILHRTHLLHDPGDHLPQGTIHAGHRDLPRVGVPRDAADHRDHQLHLR
jgi:hypothetical protein